MLFLHGFNAGAGLWEPNMEDMAEAGFRTVAPDLPGWGMTPPPPGFTYKMPDLVRWLEGFLDRTAPGPLTVVGHSFGGAVALHLALKAPERVRRLVLINAAGLSPKSKLHYRLLCVPWLGEWLLRTYPGRIRRELLEFAVSDPAAIPADVLAYLEAVVEQPWFTRTSLNWVRRNGVIWRGAAAISVRNRFAQITQPTLLLMGDRDPVIDPRDSVEAARLLPNASLVAFPGGLHLLPLDRRTEFRDLVVHFATEDAAG